MVTFFPTLTPDAGPADITAGPDGNVWFTEGQISRIGRITPTGACTVFDPTSNAGLIAITTGPDGNIWFTESARIGRITPTGAITEFAAPTGFYQDMTAGPDGNVWFVSQTSTGINRITPAGVITTFDGSVAGGNPNFFGIATGPDARLWIAELNGLDVVRFKP